MTDKNSTAAALAIVLNRDLLFGSRVRSVLKSLGLEARVVGTSEAFVTALRGAPGEVAIGIIDMNGAVSWDVIAEGLQSIHTAVPVLAFGSHKDVENLRAAKDAGVTRVVSNGQFSREMGDLIERYRRGAVGA